jgi:hypothetical protein
MRHRHKLVSAMVVIALLACAAGARAEGFEVEFELVNKTGTDIYSLALSPSGEKDWSEDLLDRDVLENGASLLVSFEEAEDADLWDLRAQNRGGKSMVWRELELAEIHTLVLHVNKGRAVAEIR